MSFVWVPCDIGSWCKIWKRDADGAQRRAGNRAVPLAIIAHDLNHFLMYHPRVIFGQAMLASAINVEPHAPYYQSRYLDERRNYDDIITYVVGRPIYNPADQDLGSAACYDAFNVDKGVAYGESVNYYVTGFEDVVCHKFSTWHEFTNAPMNIGITTQVNFAVYDMCMIESSNRKFNLDDADRVNPASFSAGEKIVAVDPSKVSGPYHLVRNWHKIRHMGLPIFFNWAAIGQTAVTSTGKAGLVTQSETFVNALDQTITTRDGNSPGAIAMAYHAGIGDETTVAGRRIPVGWSILAEATGSDGVIRLQGPTWPADNYVDITITGGAATQWYEYTPEDASKVYLDSQSPAYNWESSRNKIDIMFRRNGASGYVRIYAIQLRHENL